MFSETSKQRNTSVTPSPFLIIQCNVYESSFNPDVETKTSQELRMLSRSLCQSLTLNVMISVSHFVRNNQLCHHVTESLNRSQYLCLCFCVCLCQKGHICIGQLCSALKTLMSILTNWLTDWVTMSPIELNEVCTGAGDLSWRFVAAKKEVASL